MEDIMQVGNDVERFDRRSDVTMGRRTTVSIDDFEGAEWNTAAVL
jgi:uncharacterized protein (DUF2126 family)